MQKKGASGIFSSKDGEVNVVLFMVAFLLFLVMAVFVASVGVQYSAPGNLTINTSRNLNFTFTPTWNNSGEVIGNCSLWTNFSGTWSSFVEFNGSFESTVVNSSANITNGTTSWVNVTFAHDLGNFVWTVACRNGTESAATLNFSAGNRTVGIDAAAPVVVQTTDIFRGFNTSSAVPTINFNLTDVNGTGVNLTQNGTINISILNVNVGADTLIRADSYGIDSSLSNITCGAADGVVGVTSAQCNLTISGTPLSNGTKNITITVTDRAGWVNITSFTFTIDQIPPALLWINLTNSSQALTAVSAINGTGSLRQGQVLYLSTNLTDNLTQLLNISLEWLNTTSGSDVWYQVAVQSTNATSPGSSGAREYYWGNASFTIPTGRNEFEGRNVSFRAVYSDTLGNSNYSVTQIVQINDTYAPTISINGTVDGVAIVNGTNTTSTRPLISWIVNENNKLSSINVSVDNVVAAGKGLDATCNKFAFYDTSSAAATVSVERNRNNSFQILDDSACTLQNGTHFINITAIDIWGNSRGIGYTFTVQSGSVPALVFNNVTTLSAATVVTMPGVSAVNKSNLTSSMGLTFTGVGGAVSIANLSYVSSCNSTSTVYFGRSNITETVFPFNESTCPTTSSNVTLKVTVTDTAGSSNSTVFGFTLDNVAPTITVYSPTSGQTFADLTSVNVSAFDSESQIQWIAYYLDGVNVLLNHTMNGSRLTGGFGQNSSNINRTINFTAGTHRIKISVNDTLGNIANTSEITFVQTGPITFGNIRTSIENYSALVYGTNITNVTVRIKTDTGYQTITASNETSTNTFEINFEINGTSDNVSLSLTEINGSAVNWQRVNFTPIINDTQTEGYITTNWTNTILRAITINSSLAEFITNNNSYYGVVILPYNVTNGSNSGTASAQEFWWIPDAATVTTRTNISQCTGGFSRITVTPCWNYTSGNGTIIQVPYFGAVVAVNDSTRPPTVINNTPSTVQGVSGFVPNITLSADAVRCGYKLNITDSTKTSATSNVSSSATVSNNLCTWSEVRFKNGVYNISYNATDASGNTNATPETAVIFTMLDNTAPNNGTSITSSGSTTGATITVNSVNESITNITVVYGTTATALSTRQSEVITATTSPSISISTLSTVSSAVLYYYNVTICDYNNNCNITSNMTFTQSATAAATTTTTTSSSGGGGGGVAAPTTTVASSTSRSWDTLAADSTGTFKISSGGIAFTNIVIAVANAVSNPIVGVSSLTSNPTSSSPSGSVYQYLEITHTNIADGDISKATISFKVPKSWLTANGVAEGDVTLYRYNGGQWNALSTVKVSSDADNVWYEAVTPGFSYYAIGGKAGGTAAFAIIDMIRDFYAGTSMLTAFDIIDKIRAFYGG